MTHRQRLPAQRLPLLALAMLLPALHGCADGSSPSVAEKAPFVCSTEAAHRPPVDADTDALFRYANALQDQRPHGIDGDFTDKSLAQFNAIARYYRIANAYGHDKAGAALIALLYRLHDDSTYDGVSTSLLRQRDDEIARVEAELINRGSAEGYLYKAGERDQDGQMSEAMTYYRKAADLGSAEAQYKMAQHLDPLEVIGAVFRANRQTLQVAMQMYQCAADQGDRDAIDTLGRYTWSNGGYDEALRTFQHGVTMGSVASAAALQSIFDGSGLRGRHGHVAVDTERARRYDAIRMFLIDHQSDLDSSGLPDLSQIVPLPPAHPPAWNGTLALAKVSTPPPAEALVERLATAKGLAPDTGLPQAQEAAH